MAKIIRTIIKAGIAALVLFVLNQHETDMQRYVYDNFPVVMFIR
jgi:hypothetical protein